MTFPNPKWQPGISTTLDNAAAVDKGGGLVGVPITAHSFLIGQVVVIAGSVNYNASYEIISFTANEIVIPATYVAEVFTGAETIDFGKQVILKSDFLALETAIATQGTVRMQPPLVWVDATSVKVEATADCLAAMQFTGMPNILNPQVQVHGGLCDGKIRSVVAPVIMDFDTAGDFWGLETNAPSQWYAVFAIAENGDADFKLAAMPIMRVCSQAGQIISLGTLVTPATGRRYGFTTDEFVGGKVYFLSGDSRGLMRSITANDNATGADGTSGTITYGGGGLTMAAGDWFIVLPSHRPGETTPTINFRLVGTFLNNSSKNIVKFRRLGNVVQWLGGDITLTAVNDTVVEDIKIACPLATQAVVAMLSTYEIGHPDLGATHLTQIGQSIASPFSGFGTIEFNLEFCRYWGWITNPYEPKACYYSYPPGCGY